eukprot:m.21205 g.21205  ORF g.21205 m.21205 type:complete len:187 (+) comp3868_c0_seq1:252-812(+)
MKCEITTAVNFLVSKLMTQNGPSGTLSESAANMVRTRLCSQLQMRFSGHWYPETPLSGNGYRVVQNMDGRMDKIVMHAFQEAGVPASVVARSFPANFSIWVDPGNVSVKIGHDGSVWSLDIVSPNDVAPHHFLPDTGAVSHAASPAGTPMKRSHAMAITPSGKHRYRHIDATLMDISNVFVPSWAQ